VREPGLLTASALVLAMRKIMLLCALLALLTVVFVLGVGIDVADAARFKTH